MKYRRNRQEIFSENFLLSTALFLPGGMELYFNTELRQDVRKSFRFFECFAFAADKTACQNGEQRHGRKQIFQKALGRDAGTISWTLQEKSEQFS